MEDFLSMMLELFCDLLENKLRRIKNPGKRKWGLTIFYCVFAVLFTAVLVYMTISVSKEISKLGVLVLSTFTVLCVLVSGFLIIRQHRKN
jgi:cobalamin biosynthesis protein CobD/CbiB